MANAVASFNNLAQGSKILETSIFDPISTVDQPAVDMSKSLVEKGAVGLTVQHTQSSRQRCLGGHSWMP
jgi:hypothetical protein